MNNSVDTEAIVPHDADTDRNTAGTFALVGGTCRNLELAPTQRRLNSRGSQTNATTHDPVVEAPPIPKETRVLGKPMITCVGHDGETTLEYYVLRGDGVASEHVGWVLIVGGPNPLEPQYVTPTEIADDLRSMHITDEGVRFFVRVGTEDILKDLRGRPNAGEPSSSTAARIAELERELAQLPAVDIE